MALAEFLLPHPHRALPSSEAFGEALDVCERTLNVGALLKGKKKEEA